MLHRTYKGLLAAGVSLFSVNVAMAQDAGPTAPTIVQEITVTAQRRTERLIDVPVSVSVATGQQLEDAGITNSTDIKLITPGLNLTQQGSFVQPTIRGVGTSVVGPGADGNVALYVDGVYQAVQAAAMFELNDIDSIEVLKGPQGTLFGRNATGGAMVVTTAAPAFNTEGRFTASLGSFNDTKLTGYVTGPLTDSLAASLSVVSHRNDGYTTNVTTNTKLSKLDAFAARVKLLYRATDDLELTLAASYVNHQDNSALTYLPDDYNFQYPASVAGRLNLSDDRKVAMDFNPEASLEGGSVSLNAIYAPTWGTITSVTSYTDLDQPFFTDTDGTEMPFQVVKSRQDQKTFYQELTFASNSDQRVSWIAGATYYDDSAKSPGEVFVGGTRVLVILPSVDTEAYAVYAEANIRATDRLNFIVGGRYSSEEKTVFSQLFNTSGPVVLNNSESWNAFTPRVSARYALTPSSSLYATYSEGFKSGMFNATGVSPLDNVAIDPEKIKSYEAGYKYAGGGFLFTGAAYFYDYADIQVNAIDQTRGGFVTVTNAGSAEIYGLDFDVTAPVTDNLTIRAGASYIHGEYTEFPSAIVYVPNLSGLGFTQTTADVSGNRIMKTPEYTAFVSLVYGRDLAVGTLKSSLTAAYNDGWFWDPSNTSKQDPFTQVNARITWAPTDSVSISLFGDNLLDEAVEIFRRSSTRGDAVAYGKPRMIGVELGFAF
jgi:iron complex outermembrane receptor protein